MSVSVPIAATTAALLCLASPSQEMEDCPSSHPDISTSGTVTGYGKSLVYFSAIQDNLDSIQFAIADLKGKLGRQSGIVCGICPDTGLQCPRSAEPQGSIGTNSTFIIEGPDTWEQGYETYAFYNGLYDVSCAECIPQGGA
jgi:hypothetical protein